MKVNLKTMLLTLSIAALLGSLSMNAGRHKIDIDACDTWGYTPLIRAAMDNDLKTVKSLIEGRADINKAIKWGYTPLHKAVSNKNLEIVKYLVEHGADINKTNDNGSTPLHYAGNNLEMVKYLIERGADINKVDKLGSTPLHYAGNNLEVVKCLIEHGADINKANNCGSTPLHSVINDLQVTNNNLGTVKYSLEVVKYLVEHGAKITLKDNYNKTAFNLALNQKKILEYLTHVKNYFINKAIVTLQSVDQNNQLINPLVVPNYGPLAMKINHLCDITTFAQIPQFDDNQYLPNIRHYVKSMQLNNKCDDGFVTALWLRYKQNPKSSIIKTKAGLKFLMQKNLLTKIEDTKTPFADIVIKTQK